MKKSLIIVWMLLATADKAFMLPVNRSQTECTIPKVMVGEPTALTCYFSSNLNETKKGFSVQHVSQTGEMTEALSCLWMVLDRPKCETAPGYIFDEQIGNTLTLRIPRATEQFVGTYRCIVTLSDPNQNLPCNFNLAETSLRKTFNRTSSPTSINQVSTQQSVTKKLDIPELGEKKGEAKDKSWIPVISVLVPVGLLALVLVLIWYNRRDILCHKNLVNRKKHGEDQDSSESKHLVSTPKKNETNLRIGSPQGSSTTGTPAGLERTRTGVNRFSAIGDVADTDSGRFFENGQYERALRLLEQKGSLVITGPKRCGKSVFGRAVLDHYQGEKYCRLKLNHPKEWRDGKQTDKKCVVLFDECKMDQWPSKALSSMHLECYVIFIFTSDIMNSGNDENDIHSYLQDLPAIDLMPSANSDTNEMKELFRACQNNDFEQVVTNLTEGLNPNCPDRDGVTALHIACKHGLAEIVSHLILTGCRANTQDNTWRTPLHYVCSYSETRPVPPEQATGRSRVEEQEHEGLYHSSEYDEDYEEDSSAKVEVDDNSRKDIVERLIRLGASLDAVDDKGRTPLHYACDCSNFKVVKVLLEAGANVKTEDKDGSTPLHLACQYNNLDIVKNLIDAKSNVDAGNNKGFTPLHYACKYNQRDVVNSLLDAKADVGVKNNNGCTPLHVACANNAKASVEALLSANADVEARDTANMTPLQVADVKGYKEIVEMLIAKGADTKPKNN